MKKLLFAAIASTTIFNVACTKQQECCKISVSPGISAQKNGVEWVGKPEVVKITNDSLSISGRQTEQWLAMKIKFNGKGIYTLKGNQVTHFETVGGDVSVAEYLLDDTAVSTLEIVEYDSTRGIIRGKFSLTLKLSYRYANGPAPASVKFTNGTFTQYLPK